MDGKLTAYEGGYDDFERQLEERQRLDLKLRDKQEEEKRRLGELIGRTDISHFRPAHVHFLIDVPGYAPLITHLFQEGAQYLDSDVVFGTKTELVVAFDERDPGPTPDGGDCADRWLDARYDFVLQPEG